MMKIGVITHWGDFENYGQVFQGYMFQQYLKGRGHTPFIIRYYPGSLFSDIITLRRVLIRMLHIKDFIRSAWCVLCRTRAKAAARKMKIAPLRDFEGFRNREMSFTVNTYRSYAELVKSNEIDADMYSVGSDVVWRTVPFNDDGRVMFLDFGRRLAKRISYSASFGTNGVSEEYKRFSSPLLAKLDAVSVRELSGVAVCSSMGRNDAVCVMDPVFLMPRSFYIDKFKVSDVRKGFFGYFLPMGAELPLEEIERVAKQNDDQLSIACAGDYKRIPGRMQVNPTIPNWIRSIGEAKLFFTNSFHGTSIALIMHTPFVVFLKHGGADMDDRLISILKRAGLSNRIYIPSANNLQDIIESEIDWDTVDWRLSGEIEKSKEFLARAGV